MLLMLWGCHSIRSNKHMQKISGADYNGRRHTKENENNITGILRGAKVKNFVANAMMKPYNVNKEVCVT